MTSRKFAMYGGLIMLLMGIFASMPALSTGIPIQYPPITLQTAYGMFLGLFPMNILNKAALLLFGVFGLWAANQKVKHYDWTVIFSRTVFVVMGTAAVLGMFPETQTLNGLWPLFGAEVWTHAAFALVGAWAGWAHHVKAILPEARPSLHHRAHR